MAFLGVKGCKKADLQNLASELCVGSDDRLKVMELRNNIQGSDAYKTDLAFVQSLFEGIVGDRLAREAKLVEDRLAQEARQLEECEERKRREDQEFELQKLRLQNELNLNSMNAGHGESTRAFRPKLDLRDLIQRFDPATNDVNLYLILFERQARRAEIPKEFWASHLIGFLPYDIAQIIAREAEEVAQDYEQVKQLLLKRYKLTPEKFRQLFMKHVKGHESTWTDFAYEVKNYFQGWIAGLEIKTFDELSDVMVVDQVKRRAPPEFREHFIDTWGQIKRVEDLVKKLDDYEAIRPNSRRDVGQKPFQKPWGASQKTPTPGDTKPQLQGHKEGYRDRGGQQSQWGHPRNQNGNGGSGFQPACFSCGIKGHLRRNCPTLDKSHDPRRRANVNHASTEREESQKERNPRRQDGAAVVARVTSLTAGSGISNFGKLERISVSVNGRQANALIDSGTEITVVRSDVAGSLPDGEKSSILLQGIFGPAMKCPLVSIPISLILGGEGKVTHQEVLCAIAPTLGEDVLLPPDIRDMLKERQEVVVEKPIEVNRVEQPVEESESEQYIEENKLEADKSESEEQVDLDKTDVYREEEAEVSEVAVFRKDQEGCVDLEAARRLAKEGKGGFFIRDHLLFHKDKILGERVSQLVLPQCRREEVLKLAHSSVFGGHMGAKKTTERIRCSFFWNGLPKEVRLFCLACEDCQLVRRGTVRDRAPITPVARPGLPFQVVNVDLIGPIDPPSSKGHKYILCMVDQHTRWAEAVPITSLTAKATCEALLTIFMRTGIPNVIASDNGTNFNAQLTQEFEKRMGSSPRFSTPLYPQSNGLVERFNKTLKGMLRHAIREDLRNWHTKIPFILWAYREVPNRTTGVAPFQLLYGRRPEGPLSILKDSWTGEVKGLQLNTMPTSVYLQKLKTQLEDAAEKAGVTAVVQQEKMAHHYNLRSRRKVFKPGDRVIVLLPDSSNKLLARWQGPGVIESLKNEHSFLVKMPDGAVKHVHQNKIREFVVNSSAVNVIFEGEEEFGEVEDAPVVEAKDSFEQEIEAVPTPRLDTRQNSELRELLSEFKTLFTRTLQPVKIGEHKIELLPDCPRRRPHSYCVPMAYRQEVDRQVQELLELGLLEHAEADVTYPVVCVAKKDATVRMCVDYRALNVVTKVPFYPMKDMTELIFTAGSAKWLTCLDLLRGYYQIRMNEGSKALTAFSTHSGTYQWKVMPFGLSGAAGTFQKIMNQVLHKHGKYAHSYIDDIIIFSEIWCDHLCHVRAVLTDLEAFGFSIKLKKCTFASDEIKYLGHQIGGGKHSPQNDKVLAIRQLKKPTNKKEVRSILGLMGFYRAYIPNYAEVALPLTELTKGRKSGGILWGKREEESFRKLKDSLSGVTALSTPDCTQPFQVHTDASDYAVGCCLTQLDNRGNYKPIAFASQKLTGSQKNWATIEKEAYAVLFGLKKFDKWLHGTTVEIVTDHNPLRYLSETTPRSPKLTRWALALQRWSYKITHRAGVNHQGADALSRLDVESEGGK